MTLFIDTETTGIPIKRKGKLDNYTNLTSYDNARILQLSFLITDDKLEYIDQFSMIFKTDFEVPISKYHNITDLICKNKGLSYDYIFNKFYEYLKCCTHIIAHNIEFDINIIKSELYRAKLAHIIAEIDKKTSICTITSNLYIYKKYLTLTELYYKCFNCNINTELLHDAYYDTLNLYKCVKYLHKNNKYLSKERIILNYDILPTKKIKIKLK